MTESEYKWRSKKDFLLMAAFVTCNLNAIYSFTSHVNSHGAIFVMSYLLILFTFGMPLVHFELMQAQFSGGGVIDIYSAYPLCQGMGYAILFMLLCKVLLSAPAVAFTIAVIFGSFQSPTPWHSCADVKTEGVEGDCYEIDGELVGCSIIYMKLAKSALSQRLKSGVPVLYHGQVVLVSQDSFVNASADCSNGHHFAAEAYFMGKMGYQSENVILRVDLLLCSALSYVIMYGLLYSGLVRFNKFMYAVLCLPWILAAVVLVHCMRLPGSNVGRWQFFHAKWIKLWDVNVWLAAIIDCFISLPIGGRGFTTLARHNPYDNDIRWDAHIICAVNAAFFVMTSIILLSFQGHFAELVGQPANRVIKSYPMATAYVTSTTSLDAVPLFGVPRATAIFLVILAANAFASQLLTAEVVLDELLHRSPQMIRRQSVYRAIFYGALFLTSVACFTELAVSFGIRLRASTRAKYVIFLVLFEVFTFFRGYGLQRVLLDYGFMFRRHPSAYIRICWATITPLVLATSLLYLVFNVQNYSLPPDDEEYSHDTIREFLVLLVAVSFVLFFACCRYRDTDITQTVEALFKPVSSWGPRNKFLALDYRERVAMWEEGRAALQVATDTMTEPLLPYYTLQQPSSVHIYSPSQTGKSWGSPSVSSPTAAQSTARTLSMPTMVDSEEKPTEK